MGDTQTQPDYPRGITFEQVWAILQETALLQKETARKMEESQKEAARKMEETDRQMKETDRRINQIGKRLGNFINSFGEVVEYMISPNLLEKFRKMGYDFQEASTRHEVCDYKNDIRFEIDVFLQNGDTAMLVEIKSDLDRSDINRHIARLEKMRRYADLRGDKRRFLRAVAGIVINKRRKVACHWTCSESYLCRFH